MIQYEKTDVFYKAPKTARSVQEFIDFIPMNATVLDASGCVDLSDLQGLERRPCLEVLNLSHTHITGEALKNIPPQIQQIDLRDCPYLKSLKLLAGRASDNPVNVVCSFQGEGFLSTVPDDVILQTQGSLWGNPQFKRKHKMPLPVNVAHIKE